MSIAELTGKWVVRKSFQGYPYWSWEPWMPRINEVIQECVIYLYPTADAANQGLAAGGSGFIVGVPSAAHEHIRYIYAVTNSHVIRQGASPVIRLNTTKGDKDIIEMTEQQWLHHPAGDDIATCAIGLSPEHHRFKFIPTEMFLTEKIAMEHNIGPGDDVFIIGRLVNHEGRQRNIPSLRFGNISLMPWEPIFQSFRTFWQESFVVEARSISGFSGSPVFVQIPPLSFRPGKDVLEPTQYGPWFLGVDWGHINTQTGINTGMMGVVPAWKLSDLLNLEEIVLHRQRQDERITREAKATTLDTEHFTPPAQQ